MKTEPMKVHDVAIAKIRQLPKSLAEEVNDFIDFMLMKQDKIQRQVEKPFSESLEVAESDFSDYLANLEDYEEQLARGEIRW